MPPIKREKLRSWGVVMAINLSKKMYAIIYRKWLLLRVHIIDSWHLPAYTEYCTILSKYSTPDVFK